MRTYIAVVFSLFAVFTVGFAFSACGEQTKTYYWPEDPDAGSDADDGGDAADGDGGGGGGMAFCPGQCITIPPDDWDGPRLLWVGPEDQAPVEQCPPQAPIVAWTGHDGLHADAPQCDACACDPPSGTCSPPQTFTAHSALCYQGGVDTPFDPPPMWNGTCTADTGIDAGVECPENSGVPCVQSVTVGKLVMNESPCQPSFQPPKKVTAPTWALLGIACRGELENASCNDPGKMCVPTSEPPPPGYSQCVFQDGDIQDCPAAFPFRRLLYAAYDDSRSCTPCGCDAPEGSVCLGMATVYRDPACSESIHSSNPTSQFSPCGDVPPGSAVGSMMVTGLAYTPGSCMPTGGEPMGEAIPIEPRTFCCMA